MRRTKVLFALSCIALGATGGFVLLTAIDYWLEVGWNFRALALGLLAAASVACSFWYGGKMWKRWNRSRTAATIERQFPELGQAVRTSVQFEGDSASTAASKGAAPSLVHALQEDVTSRTRDLPLPDAVPTNHLLWATCALGALGVMLLMGMLSSWQWRLATLRTLLGNEPYTTVSVEPGDTVVDEQDTLTVSARLAGRTNRRAKLLTRTATESASEWSERELTPDDQAESKTRLVRYELEIAEIKEPFEYRVVAGRYESPTHRVDVRYPLSIKSIHVELTAPEYTGVGQQRADDGSFHAIAGSTARITIELDRGAEKGWLELEALHQTPLEDELAPRRVDCNIDGNTLAATLHLTDDLRYTIHAEGDGTKLRPNRFRIRVRQDQAPRLYFERPRDEFEVHALAEVLMRLRVSDDYGLTRAGIVVQINNEDEFTLAEQTFQETLHASAQGDGRLTPVSQAKLEELLPLEHFDLSQKDSVTFYAYAEDNLPGGAQRAESDLHFIDIRPFRRLYRFQEGGFGGGGFGGPQFTSLEALISRERLILNRTRRLAHKVQRDESLRLREIDELMAYQAETADFTLELADSVREVEQLIGIEEDRISDLFYLARQSMLSAVDSLSVGKYDTAVLQEMDATRYLVEGRNQIEIVISEGGGGALAGLFAANRRLLQKLRRPSSNKEKADEVVRRLKSLASQQDSIAKMLAEMLATAAGAPDEDDNTQDSLADDAGGEVDQTDSAMDVARRHRELEEKQLDVSLDVEDIDRIVQALQGVTDLVRNRSTRAVTMAEGVTGAIERGSTGQAVADGGAASALFRQLAENIEGIMALEAVQRIAFARDLSARLAGSQRQLSVDAQRAGSIAENGDETETVGRPTEDELAKSLSREAEQQADIGRTITDILQSIRDTFDPQQDEPARRIDEMMSAGQITQTVDRLGQVADLINGRRWAEASSQAADIADRMDIAAQQLDTLHRQFVAPRVEQLRGLELRAGELRQLLDALESDDQITRWHRRAEALIVDLEKAQVAEQPATELADAMTAAGWGQSGRQEWNWPRLATTALEPPAEYRTASRAIVEEIQRYIQELMVGGILAGQDEPVPPKYESLVERYLQVLSSDLQKASDE